MSFGCVWIAEVSKNIASGNTKLSGFTRFLKSCENQLSQNNSWFLLYKVFRFLASFEKEIFLIFS